MRLPFLLVVAALVSCVPAPHVAHLRPAVSGVIVEDGKPIPGVELFLGKFPGNNQPCADVGEVLLVSPEGGFSWAPVLERHGTDSLINPVAVRGSVTALCVRHPRKGVLIGAMLFMRQERPLSLRLACDVARPRSAGAGPGIVSTPLGQARYCRTSLSLIHI